MYREILKSKAHRPQQQRNNLVAETFRKGRPEAAHARDMTDRVDYLFPNLMSRRNKSCFQKDFINCVLAHKSFFPLLITAEITFSPPA